MNYLNRRQVASTRNLKEANYIMQYVFLTGMWNAFIPEVTLHTHTYAVSHNITADNNPISVLKMYIV